MATITINGESKEIADSTLEYLLSLGEQQHSSNAPMTGDYWIIQDRAAELLDWMKEQTG